MTGYYTAHFYKLYCSKCSKHLGYCDGGVGEYTHLCDDCYGGDKTE